MMVSNCGNCNSHRVDGYVLANGYEEYWCKDCGWEKIIEAPPTVQVTITREHIPEEILKKVKDEYDKNPEEFLNSIKRSPNNNYANIKEGAE